MPRFHIYFEWQRDEKGYDLVPAEPNKAPFKKKEPAAWGPWGPWAEEPDRADAPGYRLAKSLLAKRGLISKGNSSKSTPLGRPERIVPRGGRLTAYQPIANFPDLYTRFSAVRSATDLLRFVKQFGPLTLDGLDRNRGQDVPAMLQEAALMRQVIRGIRSNEEQIYGFNSTVYDLATVRAFLIVDRKSKELRMRLSPANLRAALWLQLGQDSEGGASVTACRECGIPFRVGAGTGRRLDADFCSDKHRIAYNSRNRGRKGKQT